MLNEDCFIFLSPPKYLEKGRNGRLQRPLVDVHLSEELNSFQFPGCNHSCIQLPGGGFAVGKAAAAVEGHVAAVISGLIENYAYLVKKYCAVDPDCQHAATRRLEDVKSLSPISPAQLLCRLYIRLGKGLVAKLRGQFSFVCYDSATIRVLAARDPSGRKQLFHGFTKHGSLVLSTSPAVVQGSCTEEVPPGFFKCGWNSPFQKYANELESVKRDTSAATTAALRALAGLKKPKPMASKEKPLQVKRISDARDLPEVVCDVPLTGPVTHQNSSTCTAVGEPQLPDTCPLGMDEALSAALAADSQQARLLSNLLDSAQGAFVVTDAQSPDNPIVYANKRFEEASGYSLAEVQGRNCRFLQAPPGHPRAPAPAASALRRSVAEGQARSARLLNYRKDGTPVWNDLCVLPVRSASGAVTHFVGLQTFHDLGLDPIRPEPFACTARSGAAPPSASPAPSPRGLSALGRSSSCNALGTLANRSQSCSDLLSAAAGRPGVAC
uniref:Pas pac sensor signal transduction histidine kinase n=1 Tax=Tetraselmis sp. GSL018 TaxID=582737 RepID=A0A061S3C1_9CHLO